MSHCATVAKAVTTTDDSGRGGGDGYGHGGRRSHTNKYYINFL